MNEQTSTYRTGIKWGLILGLVSIVYSLVLFTTGSIGKPGTSIASIVLSVGGLVLAMREFRTLNGGFMSFGQGVTVGTVTGLVAGIFSTLFSWFYMTMIDPNVMTTVLDQTREELDKQGMLSDEQIDTQMEMMERFMTPGFMLGSGLAMSLIGSLILALIIAAFMKKNKVDVFE